MVPVAGTTALWLLSVRRAVTKRSQTWKLRVTILLFIRTPEKHYNGVEIGLHGYAVRPFFPFVFFLPLSNVL